MRPTTRATLACVLTAAGGGKALASASPPDGGIYVYPPGGVSVTLCSDTCADPIFTVLTSIPYYAERCFDGGPLNATSQDYHVSPNCPVRLIMNLVRDSCTRIENY